MPRAVEAFSLLLLAVVAVVMVGAVPRRSLAADGKILGGQVCELGPAPSSATVRYDSDGIEMVSTGGTVMCTMIRDNVTNTNGLSDVELSVNDPTGGGGVICDLLAQDRHGTPVKVVRRTSSRNGPQVLDWGGSLNVGASKGTYSFICLLPPGGRISSLYFNEF